VQLLVSDKTECETLVIELDRFQLSNKRVITQISSLDSFEDDEDNEDEEDEEFDNGQHLIYDNEIEKQNNDNNENNNDISNNNINKNINNKGSQKLLNLLNFDGYIQNIIREQLVANDDGQ
jgi:hypothetical protein